MEEMSRRAPEDIIHKINSPLTTIIGYSQLLNRKISKGTRNLEEKDVEWLKTIEGEALKIKELMQELSDSVRKG
jgi:signal transduction histidine kinase